MQNKSVFASRERTAFFEKSGLPYWNLSHNIGEKKVTRPFILYMCQKESKEKISAIQKASVEAAKIFNIVGNRIKRWDISKLTQWKFDKKYAEFLKAPWDDIFCMRIGWGWKDNKLKLFEINCQTPLFWFSIEEGNQLLAKQFGYKNPTPQSMDFLKQSLNQSIEKRLQELPKQKRLHPTAGFVTGNFPEEFATMRWLSTFCRYNNEVLPIEDLDFTKKNNFPFHRKTGTTFDVLIFWYPLEWIDDLMFVNGEKVWDVFLNGLTHHSFILLHAIPAFFMESKSILAYITHHASDLFVKEKADAEQFFPKSYISPEKLGKNYFAKPVFGRQGRGCFLIKKNQKIYSQHQDSYYVQQPKIYQELLEFPKITLENKTLTLIYESWVYKIGNIFVPGGVGIRGTEYAISDDSDYYIPLGI